MFVFPEISEPPVSAAVISDSSDPEYLRDDPEDLEFIRYFPPARSSFGNEHFDNDLIIDFSFSNMTSEDFHPHFLGPSFSHYNSTNSSSHHKGTTRSMGLSVDLNRFEFLSESVFLDFFLAHKNNSISLLGNPIVCDERSAWLGKRGVQKTQVLPQYCMNLPYVRQSYVCENLPCKSFMFHPTLYTFPFESLDWKGHENYNETIDK